MVLSLDISELSSLVMGAVPLRDLLRMGLVSLSHTRCADDVQNAIDWGEKPRNLTYF